MDLGSENEIWLGERTHAKHVMSFLRTRIQPALSTQNRLISIVNDAYQSIFLGVSCFSLSPPDKNSLSC